MNVPDDLRYATSHEWLRSDGTVGITDHAQAELTDVVYVELPKIGAAIKAGQQCCVVESVKAASDIYAPATGKVAAINEALTSNPALINSDPYGEGWIFRLELETSSDTGHLQSPAGYRAQLGG
ncbi:MAG: glycine cleavage system protein GcvH [Chthoniobacteraceae bacterium]